MVIWLCTPLRWSNDLLERMEVSRLRDTIADLRKDVERLEHEVVLQSQRAEAAEDNVLLLRTAHETNLKLLDAMVITHGKHSVAR